jgi:hypothetical protein
MKRGLFAFCVFWRSRGEAHCPILRARDRHSPALDLDGNNGATAESGLRCLGS